MNFIDKMLLKRIGELSEHAEIPPEVRSRIELAMRSGGGFLRNSVGTAVNIVGVLFLVFSALLLVEYNWYSLGLFWQTIMFMILLAVFVCIGGYTIFYKYQSGLMREISALLGFGAALSIFVGLNVAYQINLPDEEVYFFLFTLPLGFAFSSKLGVLFSIISFICLRQSNCIESDFSLWTIAIFMPVLCASCFYYMIYKFDMKNMFASLLTYAFLALVFFLILKNCNSVNSEFSTQLTFFVASAAFFAYGVYLYCKKCPLMSNGFLLLGGFLLCLIMFVITFLAFSHGGMNNPSWFLPKLGFNYIFLKVGGAILFAAFVGLFCYAKIKGAGAIIFAPCPILISFALVYFGGDTCKSIAEYAANFSILFFALCLLVKGVKERSVSFVNFGVLLFVVYAVVRTLNSDLPILVRAGILGLTGVATIVFNAVYFRKIVRSK